LNTTSPDGGIGWLFPRTRKLSGALIDISARAAWEMGRPIEMSGSNNTNVHPLLTACLCYRLPTQNYILYRIVSEPVQARRYDSITFHVLQRSVCTLASGHPICACKQRAYYADHPKKEEDTRPASGTHLLCWLCWLCLLVRMWRSIDAANPPAKPLSGCTGVP